MGKKEKIDFESSDLRKLRGEKALHYIRDIKKIVATIKDSDPWETLYERVEEISSLCGFVNELFFRARHKGEFVEINPGDKIDGIPF